ncbi:hypothetical protein NF699_06550 [Sphingomonadaceae bacterium OTU29LAMAA1]|nr:hypothetical protein NF699_06550 [Sphingomonadaceae bacterium OTU29LAMAA1]
MVEAGSPMSNWRKRMIAGLGPGIRGLTAFRQQQRMSMYQSGLSDAAIAAQEGVTKNAIAAWRARRQLPPHDHHLSRLTPAAEARRRSLFATEMGDREVAKKLGKSRGAVRDWRVSRGIPPKEVRRRTDGEIGLICSISLDDLGSFGRSRYETIADSSWSSWLEEMGATVW